MSTTKRVLLVLSALTSNVWFWAALVHFTDGIHNWWGAPLVVTCAVTEFALLVAGMIWALENT
jgi:hypothetical protein